MAMKKPEKKAAKASTASKKPTAAPSAGGKQASKKPPAASRGARAAKQTTHAASGTGAAKKKTTAAKSTANAAAHKSGTAAGGDTKSQTYSGSCHCGRIAFKVDGSIDQVMDCNCSMCQRRGGLLWFVPRSAMRLGTAQADLSTYTFNKHLLKHHFCGNCGIAPFSEGEKQGEKMASINVRCLEGVDLSKFKVVKYDGRKS